MAVAVLFEPAPTISGTRPATVEAAHSIISARSVGEMVEGSPVVPSTMIASVMLSICQSISVSKERRSTLPSENGVTSATPLP